MRGERLDTDDKVQTGTEPGNDEEEEKDMSGRGRVQLSVLKVRGSGPLAVCVGALQVNNGG